MLDDILGKYGLKFDEIRPDEQAQLLTMVEASQKGVLTIERVREHITQLKFIVEGELADIKDTPQTWLSLITYLIPLVGLIRHWYQDQRALYLKARLRNLTLLYDILSRPDRAKADIEAAVGNLAKSINTQRDFTKRW